MSLYGNLPRHLQSSQADVAQMVEQSIRNRQVIGSIPIVGSSKPLRSMYLAVAADFRQPAFLPLS